MFEALYTDRMTVYRAVQSERTEGVFEEPEAVYENVPCRVSVRRRLFAGAGEVVDEFDALPRSAQRFTLFHAPDIVIKAGDRVKAVKNGAQIRCVVGDSVVYEHHAETPAAAEKPA